MIDMKFLYGMYYMVLSKDWELNLTIRYEIG